MQSIAAAVYGNPSLWFVLAEANNLAPGAELKAGSRIQIANNIQSGRITADTHRVYNESDIIGSTLPNLKSPPAGGGGGCGGFLAILIIVVIAFVAFYAVGVLANSAVIGGWGAGLSTATGSAIGATTASGLIAGAIVGAAASVVQQGLFIAMGYQDNFSWKAVAAGAISGAFTGAARGLATNAAAEAAKKGVEVTQYAKVAAAALNVAGAASKQLIEHGKITSWTSLATAALGSTKTLGKVNIVDVGTGAESVINELPGISTDLGIAMDYVSPWLEVAESYVRNGELTTADWVGAVGGTLSHALTSTDNSISRALDGNDTAINMLVGGAMSAFDRQTGMNFIANTVGQEVGSQVVAGLERYVSAPSRAVEVGGKGQRDRAAELGLTEAFAGIDSGKLNPDIRTADLGGWQLGPNQAYDVLTKEEFDAAVFANDGMVPAEWIGNAGIGGSVVITPDSGGVRGYTPSGAMIDEAGNVSYRISQGDNLSTIAQGIGSSVEELAAYNNIDDPNIIIAGNVIRKPPAGFKIDRSSQVAMHSDFELVEQQTVTINNAVSDARQSPEKLDFQSVTATGESINDRLVRMGGVSANVTGVHRGIYGSYRAGFFKSLAGEVGLGGFFDDIQDQADIEAYRETLVPGTTIKTGDVFDYSLRTAEVLSVVKALPSLAKSIRNWGSVVPDSIRETGARQILDPNSARAWEELADIQYDAIRANGSDITKIAENTGWAESRIARIKDHVFFKEHQLSSGVRRFDSDVDMANAWNRLETGDFVKSDIDLLRHEIFEAKFEGIFKTDYVKAHEATISPRVNRTWTPE